MTFDTGPEGLEIQTDERMVKQVLVNLLSNAVKFAPEGGQVAVSVTLEQARGTVGIAVSDTGIGISSEDMAAALAPFSQVDSSLSRQFEGTGLGLPLSKRFTEILGGTF